MSTVSYSVILNGNIRETFLPSRGLRQGDPFSPFLFLFCGEGISSLMRLSKANNILHEVKASLSVPAISHLLFEDDCILFAEATKRGAHSLRQIMINLLSFLVPILLKGKGLQFLRYLVYEDQLIQNDI